MKTCGAQIIAEFHLKPRQLASVPDYVGDAAAELHAPGLWAHNYAENWVYLHLGTMCLRFPELAT